MFIKMIRTNSIYLLCEIHSNKPAKNVRLLIYKKVWIFFERSVNAVHEKTGSNKKIVIK